MKTSTILSVPDATAALDYMSNNVDNLSETMMLNMGPSHPATHGVLRLALELDGEIVTKCDPVVGHLHRGMEKSVKASTTTSSSPTPTASTTSRR